MLIKIDYRENKLLEICQRMAIEGIQIKSENLPLGDMIIYDEAGQEKAIIERKSLADLAASIRDGRYSEQGFRLEQCSLHNHQIYYLIEGELRFYKPFKGLPDKKTLLSAMTSISYFKGFSLYRTVNIEETAEWLMHFAAKLMKEGPEAVPYYSKVVPNLDAQAIAGPDSIAGTGAGPGGSADSYANAMAKRIKKNNISPENIGEIMLSQIPNVSNAAALAIMAKFGTFAKLMSALQADPNSLNDVTTANKNGQLKKISKPCINNIYHFLVKAEVIVIP